MWEDVSLAIIIIIRTHGTRTINCASMSNMSDVTWF